MKSRGALVLALLCAAVMPACSLPRSALGSRMDGAIAVDMGVRVVPDAWTGDAAPDLDVGVDGGTDAGLDGGTDAGSDAFVSDSGIDANLSPDTGCVVGELMCHSNGDIVGCDPDGVIRYRMSCPLGCGSPPDVHCVQLRASHITDETLLPSGDTALHVTTGQSVQIDTDTGAITMGATVIRAGGTGTAPGTIGFSVQVQPTGAALGVFTVSTLDVDSGATLSAIGARALVILASGNVMIDGAVDVGARGNAAGPGGYAGGGHRANGGGPSHGGAGENTGIGDVLMSGGGGGGHGGSGGGGGDEHPFCCDTANGGGGGGTSTDGDGSYLMGGSGGGGGADASNGGIGGGGGGALQITSLTTIHITTAGIVRAPGGGASHGDQAGGGGGAGGTIFLESLTIGLDNIVSVTGGGGGGGRSGDGARGTDTTNGAGGGGGGSGGGSGGGGAAGGSMNGGDGGDGDGGGGGGGEAGVLFALQAAAAASAIVPSSARLMRRI